MSFLKAFKRSRHISNLSVSSDDTQTDPEKPLVTLTLIVSLTGSGRLPRTIPSHVSVENVLWFSGPRVAVTQKNWVRARESWKLFWHIASTVTLPNISSSYLARLYRSGPPHSPDESDVNRFVSANFVNLHLAKFPRSKCSLKRFSACEIKSRWKCFVLDGKECFAGARHV